MVTNLAGAVSDNTQNKVNILTKGGEFFIERARGIWTEGFGDAPVFESG